MALVCTGTYQPLHSSKTRLVQLKLVIPTLPMGRACGADSPLRAGQKKNIFPDKCNSLYERPRNISNVYNDSKP